MRENLPITDGEYVMQDGRPIVSKTDLKGNITYVNPYFVEVSGYTEEELLGQPHNLVRHPDMPEVAFQDEWSTISSGETWSGVVKNRRHNGDYYWVMSNVTPITERGRITGFMSVCTKPTRQQIDVAAAAYAEMRRGADAKLTIIKGQLHKQGLIYQLWRAVQMPYNTRLALVMMAMVGLMSSVLLTNFFVEGGMPWWANVAVVLTIISTLEVWRFQHVRVGRPLNDLTRYALSLAGGDLSGADMPKNAGEAGRLAGALSQLDANLLAAIGDIHTHADIIQTATAEIAAGNMDLSARTESQASSLEETASSMEEFAATVDNNAKFAQEANQLAHRASGVAREGGDAIANVGKTMEEISAASHRIADIIGVIDGIAFQTNILALNAAVEAARAGEAGRGFAVVAGEVRALAQRSGAAAKEIRGLIQDSVSKVETGNALVGNARQTMGHVVDAVVQVAGIMEDIASASREQAMSIKQVNEAIALMDNITQQNAALVEQAAAGAANLHEEAVHLGHAVSVLNTGGGESLAPARSKPSAKPAGGQERLPALVA